MGVIEAKLVRTVMKELEQQMRACGYEDAATMVNLALIKMVHKEMFISLEPGEREIFAR